MGIAIERDDLAVKEEIRLDTTQTECDWPETRAALADGRK